MTPDNKYLSEYLLKAAIEQVASEYKDRGYTVTPEQSIGDSAIDLVAVNEKKSIYFQFLLAKSESAKLDSVLDAKRRAEQDDAEFRLIYVSPPTDVEVCVEGIEVTLMDSLIQSMPSELDELSTHTSIEDVDEVRILGVHIQADKIEIRGSFVLGVSLQFGSDGDQRRGEGFRTEESLVTDFHAEFGGNLELTSLSVDIDTSSVYE